jgi:menaquinol-cytochrome c reductase cytochrome b/c subunit
MAEEVEIDQQVYDELIAQGKSERIARAKAKAAAMRAKKAAAGETMGPREGAAESAAAAPAAAAAGGGDQPAAGVATKERAGGALTPEERQARVAAALAAKGGDQPRTGDAKLVGQSHTHRLLAMVPPTGIQQIRGKQDDKVYTWPHLIAAEFTSLLVMTVFLVIFSALVQAPLLDLANANQTPNPSKAPWYFMGLQELLRYFHPMVAGVTIPTIGIVISMVLPYIDKNPSVKPENRKVAYIGFTMALVFNAILVIVGSFFRGPGFNWVWPWVDGLWFQL